MTDVGGIRRCETHFPGNATNLNVEPDEDRVMMTASPVKKAFSTSFVKDLTKVLVKVSALGVIVWVRVSQALPWRLTVKV